MTRGRLAAIVVLLLVAAGGALAWRAGVWQSAIAPGEPPAAARFPAEQVARGAALARLGDCAVCHTSAPDHPLAGGLSLPTPFGAVIATNITPDPDAGIGRWSLDAFVRAMREGVSRDGSHLYPAFPYTNFTRASDADLAALYAFLMTRPAVAARPPPTRLPFPFNMRVLMAGWNLLFLRAGPYRPDPQHDAAWNRGAYLATGLGHCDACHSPRNLLGAAKGGDEALAGGVAEGWQALALTPASADPVAWTQDALLGYLRTGRDAFHGVALGPMRPVVREGLSKIDAADVAAIATYIMSFRPAGAATGQPAALQARIEAAGYGVDRHATDPGAALFAGACASCHNAGGPRPFAARPVLALDSAVHAPGPANLVRTILAGVPPGVMPGFAGELSDDQLSALAGYLRATVAGAPAWPDLRATVARIRATPDGP